MIHTERLMLTPISAQHSIDLFEMDSNPAVHKYIYKQPVKSISEVDEYIKAIQQQYLAFNTGRLAVLNKATNECIGWCGIKYIDFQMNNHINFYDLGYRFKESAWGKGYAFESSLAVIKDAFKKFTIEHIFATAHPDNIASRKVLEKLGFQFVEFFEEDGIDSTWYHLDKASFEARFED